MRGSVYAYKSGKRVEDPFTPETRIVGVDRQGLAAFLVDEASLHFPDAITFHWGAAPAGFDLAHKKLTCSQVRDAVVKLDRDTAAPVPGELCYDLLIGADGASSAVRAAMLAAVPGMNVQRLTSPVAELEYKAFHSLPWNDAIRSLMPQFPTHQAPGPQHDTQATSTTATTAAANTSAAADPGMVFFAFNNPQPNQPSPGSITVYLNAAGTWSGTLYQPPGHFEAMSGDVAAHAAAIRQFTPAAFPEEWIPEMARQMAGISHSRISPMQLVSHLASPSHRVVLLGDAGHSVTPQMGQGCNSALEDTCLLAAALQAADYNIAAGLARFEQQRMPQVHALQRMEEENSWVRRPANLTKDPIDKTLARIAWVIFFMLLPLLRLVPGMQRAVHASLFQTIMSTRTPYNQLHTAIRLAPLVAVMLVLFLVWGGKALMGLGLSALAASSS